MRLGENEYQYFLYDVECDECTLLFGLQSFSGGDPDMFINHGQEDLPDKENHDFESAAYGNEVLTLDLKDKYFVDRKMTSMKETYTIAVFGKREGTFVLSASQNKHRIIALSEGIKLRRTQQAYETQQFKWETNNVDLDGDDIKIELSVKSGKVDLYVNTFD